MNILIFSWRGVGHPNSGGAEVATHEHSKAWVKAGHSVTVFTSYYKGCNDRETIDGVQFIRRGRQLVGVQIAGVFWYLFGRHEKYDIVVDQFHGIPFFTPLYVKTKILAYIHEVATEVWKKNELPRPYNLIAAYVGPIVEPLIFKFYKKIDFLTVSDSTKKDLIGFGVNKTKITVIENGVITVKVKIVKKEKIITFLGALSRDKGVEDSIRILAEVLRKDEGWKLKIVGKGNQEYISKLKTTAKELGINKNVEFTGYVAERKKFEILARSFCLVNPSIHEGWGLVNIEANSVGTPVFGYKVKGITDSVVDNNTGILVDIGDVRQTAMEMVKLQSDKKRYETLSQNCLKWSNKFSWKKSTKESLELIESI